MEVQICQQSRKSQKKFDYRSALKPVKEMGAENINARHFTKDRLFHAARFISFLKRIEDGSEFATYKTSKESSY